MDLRLLPGEADAAGAGEGMSGALDVQVGGEHYRTLAVQPWDAMQAWMTHDQFVGYLTGCAIKYLARDKGDRLQDVKKARHYLDRLIEVMEQGDG